ncbi:MAG: hypothetical protein ACE148_15565 [Vicinamibacterales bacterium]
MERADRNLRALIISAMSAALALTLPTAFHAVGLGSSFLPMLLPLLLGGFLVPLSWAAPTAAIVPVVSSLATGMPPMYPPIALVMSAEAAVMAGTAAAVFALTGGRVWPALIAGVVLGRATMVLLTWLVAGSFGLPATFSAAASLAQGAPGVVLQCAVVPAVLGRLRARRGPLFQ